MSETILSHQQIAKGQPPLVVCPATAELLKRGAIALSIANLCFFFLWHEVLLFASHRTYFLMKPPSALMFWSLIIDVLVLAAVIWGLLFLCESRSRPLKILAAVPVGAAGIVALGQIYHAANRALSGLVGGQSTLVLRIAVAGVVLFFLIRSPNRLRAGLRVLFLILCPLFFVYAAQGFWLYEIADANIGPGKAAGMLPASVSHNRVIWIIFDEMDYRLSFPARPPRIQLRHFDALRRISVFADHVKSPAHNTIAAMPSLLLAKDIPRDEDVDIKPRPIQVRFSGCSRFVSIRSQPNVFRRARKLGFNTAVSGWYHSYCRDFGSDLSACTSIYGFRNATGVQTFLRAKPLWETATYLAKWQGRAIALHAKAVVLRNAQDWRILSIPERAFVNRRIHIARLRSEIQHGLHMLRNRRLNFVLLHFSIPHPPGIWNTKAQTFTTSPRSDYIDNLALADHVLGKVRHTLEQIGDWDRSTILVSADHPYRPTSWLGLHVASPQAAPSAEMIRDTHRIWQPHIPFILKVPGQKTGVAYHNEFNSVLSGNLLLAALQGEIRTAVQAVQWLDAHAAASEQNVCR